MASTHNLKVASPIFGQRVANDIRVGGCLIKGIVSGANGEAAALSASDAINGYAKITAYNCAFNLDAVEKALLETGFRSVRFARDQDLDTPVENPEAEIINWED